MRRAVTASALGRRLRRAIPTPLRALVRVALSLPTLGRLAADRASLRTMIALDAGRGRGLLGTVPVAIRLRPLGGRRVWLRSQTSDMASMRNLLLEMPHLPPADEVASPPRLIVDLGAHIGLSMAHLASVFPAARVVGVEMDDDNVALARRNIAGWGERCELVHAAVMPEDGVVTYSIGTEPDEFRETNAYSVIAERSAAGVQHQVPAISLDTLLLERLAGASVDFLKMDIEGAEGLVLTRRTDWAAVVRVITVEVHSPYTAARCLEDLRRLGFEARVDAAIDQLVVGRRAR